MADGATQTLHYVRSDSPGTDPFADLCEADRVVTF